MPVEMTENDKKKEFLRRYRECERREQEILEEIQRLRADKMFPSMVNDGMPKGSQQSDLSDYMVLLDEQIDRLKQEQLKQILTVLDEQLTGMGYTPTEIIRLLQDYYSL